MATACRQAAQLADAGSRLAALERDLERRQEQVRAAEATAATHNAREGGSATSRYRLSVACSDVCSRLHRLLPHLRHWHL